MAEQIGIQVGNFTFPQRWGNFRTYFLFGPILKKNNNQTTKYPLTFYLMLKSWGTLRDVRWDEFLPDQTFS